MTARPGRGARPAGRTDGGAGLAPPGLCRGEGAPRGAARGLADDAGGDQLSEQAEGGPRRDRQAFRQAVRGDDRGSGAGDRAPGAGASVRCGRGRPPPFLPAASRPVPRGRSALRRRRRRESLPAIRCRPAGRGGDGAGLAPTRRAGGYPGRSRHPARGRRRGTCRPWRVDRCGPAGSSSPGRRAPRGSAPAPDRACRPSTATPRPPCRRS